MTHRLSSQRFHSPGLAAPARDDSGQALVEAAIVTPLLLFLFLCLLQILLMAHARVQLDYAAFNAARAGAVHNGDPSVMRNAALISMLPVFGPTQDVPHFMQTWARVKVLAGIGELFDTGEHWLESFAGDALGIDIGGLLPRVSLVHVDILNPGRQDFVSGGENLRELDFDAPARIDVRDDDALRRTRLSIRVRWLFRLGVPLADRAVWYMYMGAAYLRARLMGSEFWDPFRGRYGAIDEETALSNASFATDFDYSQFANGPCAFVHDQLMFQALRLLPRLPSDGLYMIPIYSTYNIPMESNLFLENVRRGSVGCGVNQ